LTSKHGSVIIRMNSWIRPGEQAAVGPSRVLRKTTTAGGWPVTIDRSRFGFFLFLTVGLFGLTGLAGCGRSGSGAAKDERTVDDLLAHLKQNGVRIQSHEEMEYKGASKAWVFKTQGEEFYVVRFDLANSSERKALQKIASDFKITWGKTVLPVRVNGSFVLVGFETKDGISSVATAFDAF
jgi:hypothetical protein